jgi:Fe2+ or Zn2+ uptake regulation protein
MSETETTNRCVIHEVDEPLTETTHRVCFECGHVYETPTDVEQLHREIADDYTIQVSGKKAEDILFCPLCLHDW